MFRRLTLAVGAVVWLSAVPLQAQHPEAVLGQMYGSGVHAYFSQDYGKAYEALTAAVDGGSKDPRVYYFRGLAFLRLGRPEEAALDFQKGADQEAADVNRVYDVARALERVQGALRARLESYRVEARMKALARAEEYDKARYGQRQERERQAIEEQAAGAERPIEPPATPASPKDLDPFSAKPAEPGVTPTPEPSTEPPKELSGTPPESEPREGPPDTMPESKPEVDPFETKPEPKMPAEADPFSGGLEKPDTPKPPVPPTTEPDMPPTTEPGAAPAGEGKPGGVFGALRRALGKAVGGDSGGSPPPGEPPPTEPGLPDARPLDIPDDSPAAKPEMPAVEPAEPVEPAAPAVPPGDVDPGDPFSTPAPGPSPTTPPAKPAAKLPAKTPAFDPNDPFAEEPAKPAP